MPGSETAACPPHWSIMTIPDTQTSPRLPWDAADPYPFYESRRRDGNIVWDDTAQAWLVLSHSAARDILSGPGWSADPRANPGAELLNSAIVNANMLFTDGSAHSRLRNAVRDLFGRNFITGLTDGVDTITADIIDAIPDGEPFDAMADIALPLPVAVIGAWLGLDPEQCAALREYSPAIIRLLGGFTDEHALEEGLSASAGLIADFLPPPPTAAPTPETTCSATWPPIVTSASTKSPSPPSSSPSPATKPPPTSSVQVSSGYSPPI